jgi:hypothetical protein
VQRLVPAQAGAALEDASAFQRRGAGPELLEIVSHQDRPEAWRQHDDGPLPRQFLLLVEQDRVHTGRHVGRLRRDQPDHRRRRPAGDALVDPAFPLEIGQPLEQREDHHGPVLSRRERRLFQRVGDGHQGLLGQPLHGRGIQHRRILGTARHHRIR